MTSFLEQAGPKPYQRCLVMCGGGFRFGYYLGVYAAMEEHGHKPDLLLATCGAAIAANVIAGLETDAQRRAWLDSEAMFAFWQSLRWNPRQSMITVSKSLLKRWATPPQYKRIPDLYQDFLFSVPGELPLPPLSEKAGSDVAVIAGKILYPQHATGQWRSAPWFEETIFTNSPQLQHLHGQLSPVSAAFLPHSRVAPQLSVIQTADMADAARASVSDMFYFPCHRSPHGDFLGGVTDLFPMEIANALAAEVWMEKKAEYDWFKSLPAVRRVLGFNGNHRLRKMMQSPAAAWIDTSDMETALVEHQIRMRADWRQNRIHLSLPEKYEQFLAMNRLQWEYGYQRGMQTIASLPNAV